jgi:tRNA G18 (ribose-2'-O)-methylase SpoU
MKKEIHLVLCNIRSRENVGSIFRTADAVGVSKIYLCGITPTPPHEKISKTALGAEEFVDWEYCKDTWRLLGKLKKDKINIVALEQTKESTDLFKFKSKFPLALVVGNEVNGLSPQILKYCDKKISISMYGKKESLNVSVAVGIALYQLIK